MPEERRAATLLAFIQALLASAQDDVLDLFDLVVTKIFADAIRKGREARLRNLGDLDAAALTLSKVCALVLDGAVDDGGLQAVVFAAVPKEALEAAVAQVDSLTRPAGRSLFRRAAGPIPQNAGVSAASSPRRRSGRNSCRPAGLGSAPAPTEG
jgi:hypothetical protein